jgi:hypothetical protein
VDALQVIGEMPQLVVGLTVIKWNYGHPILRLESIAIRCLNILLDVHYRPEEYFIAAGQSAVGI